LIYGGISVATQSPKGNCGAVDEKPLKPALDMGLRGFRIVPTEEFRFMVWAHLAQLDINEKIRKLLGKRRIG